MSLSTMLLISCAGTGLMVLIGLFTLGLCRAAADRREGDGCNE